MWHPLKKLKIFFDIREIDSVISLSLKLRNVVRRRKTSDKNSKKILSQLKTTLKKLGLLKTNLEAPVKFIYLYSSCNRVGT